MPFSRATVVIVVVDVVAIAYVSAADAAIMNGMQKIVRNIKRLCGLWENRVYLFMWVWEMVDSELLARHTGYIKSSRHMSHMCIIIIGFHSFICFTFLYSPHPWSV